MGCEECDDDCFTCGTSAKECLTCKNGYYILHNNTCAHSCEGAGNCNDLCDPACQTCYAEFPTTCITCSEDYQFVALNNSCVVEEITCEDNEYLLIVDRAASKWRCEVCDSSCV